MFTPFAFVKSAAAAGGPILWTPAQISTLAWYDASNESSVTLNGTDVSQINDLSGNGYNATQSTSSLQPAYTNTLNSLKIMTFDGTNKLNLPSVNFNTDKSVSLYVVTRKRSTSGAFQVIAAFWKSGTNTAAILAQMTDGPNFWGSYTGNQDPADSALNTTDSYVLSLVASTTDGIMNFWRTGVADGSDGDWSTTTVFSEGALGNDQYGSSLNGDIAEIVLINQKDSTAERQEMEGYLAWKWGLEAGLPAGHPYKDAPPYV
jgi:hypothetical protein